jgi:hypothetical protein
MSAIEILTTEGGIAIPGGLFSAAGSITLEAATATIRAIESASRTSPKPVVRDAAAWLMRGTPFDECNYADAAEGPFPLKCIQREFRKAGCQASGTGYPRTAEGAFSGLSMGQIRTQFRDLYMAMTKSDIQNLSEQDDAVRACLGIQLKRDANQTWTETPNICNDPGIEYFMYAYRGTGEGVPVIVGHYIHRGATNYISSLEPSRAVSYLVERLSTISGKRGYLARCMVDAGEGTETVTVTANAAHRLRVNGLHAELGVAVPLLSRQRNMIELQYMGETNVFEAPTIRTSNNRPLRLNQSVWKPMISLGPTVGGNTFEDLNRIAEFMPSVQSVATLGARRFAQLTNKQITSYGLGYRMDAFRTVTCMFKWSATLPKQVTLFRFDRGGGGNEYLSCELQEGVPVIVLKTDEGAYTIRCAENIGVTNNANKWIHLAVVLNADAGRVGVYRDGRRLNVSARTFVEVSGLQNIEFMRWRVGDPNMSIGLAWFHIYANALSAEEIGRDMRYDSRAVAP